jgi:NOL1/NOP2/fmu family ribosome biogenesis protein
MKNLINLKLTLCTLLLMLLTTCSDDDTIQYQLTTQVSPAETGTITPPSGLYNEGTEIELKATPIEEYIFKNWTGDASGNVNPLTITMLEDKNITAVFEKVNYSLTIEIVGEGTVNQEIVLAKSSSKDYESGTTVQLTAVPDAEWRFVEWSGDYTGTENPIQLTMDQAMTLTAKFEKVSYALTIEIEGNGTVNQEIIQAKSTTDYESGTKVQLTAVPDTDWMFVGWSGDFQGSENPITVTMSQAMSIMAKFLPQNLEKTYVPDDNFEKALIDLGYDEEMDDYVYTQLIKLVENLNLERSGIENLTGIENFEALVHLAIADNQISSLDISKNVNLEFLNCNNNELTSLDLSQNINLIVMFAMNNPLVCVQINEAQLEKIGMIPWLGGDGFYSDDGVIFSLDCDALSNSTTYVPDDNFEQALIDLGQDDVLDDYVKTIDIAGLRGLDLSDKNISDLTGIEDFAMLWSLDCSGNNISEISALFGLPLYSIDLSKNQLSSLNLTEFGCAFDIDVRENPLSCIQVSEEQLECMEVSGFGSLQVLKDEDVIISLDCGN